MMGTSVWARMAAMCSGLLMRRPAAPLSSSSRRLQRRGCLAFPPQVARHVSFRLSLEHYVGRHLREPRRRRIFERSMSPGVMVALDDIIKMHRTPVIAPDSKPDCVPADGIHRKPTTLPARVSEITKRTNGSLIWLAGLPRHCAADPCPQISQGEHARTRVSFCRARLQWIKIRTGHFRRYSNTHAR